MERHEEGLKETVPQEKKDAEPVSTLSADDDAWLDDPSATPDISWIEDDLQKTPVDELMSTDPVPGRVPFNPELALTPPPATPQSSRLPAKTPIRRPVIERVRPREELRQAAVATAPRKPIRPKVIVQADTPVRTWPVYAVAIVAGIASGVAVLLLGK